MNDLTEPLQQYNRQAHLAWYEKTYPNLPEWPPVPRTNLEASDAILAYTGRQAEQDGDESRCGAHPLIATEAGEVPDERVSCVLAPGHWDRDHVEHDSGEGWGWFDDAMLTDAINRRSDELLTEVRVMLP